LSNYLKNRCQYKIDVPENYANEVIIVPSEGILKASESK